MTSSLPLGGEDHYQGVEGRGKGEGRGKERGRETSIVRRQGTRCVVGGGGGGWGVKGGSKEFRKRRARVRFCERE